jgi:hypothetical protein
VTPTLSLAFAVTVTVPPTAAPFAGDVTEVVGGVVSPGEGVPNSEWSSRLGEPDPELVTLLAVVAVTSDCIAVAGEAVGFVCR